MILPRPADFSDKVNRLATMMGKDAASILGKYGRSWQTIESLLGLKNNQLTSPRQIMVITGSRALADPNHHGAMEWCEDLLRNAVRDDKSNIIVCGDAIGPDRWGRDLLQSTHLVYEYRAQSGDIWAYAQSLGHPPPKRVARWINPDELCQLPASVRPLRRNAAMIKAVSLRDPFARVEGFVDPESATKGTAHTIKHAEKLHLRININVWGTRL